MKIASSPIYLDTSALAKLYIQESESDVLDAALTGRTDLIVSHLGMTELVSALVRRAEHGDVSHDHVRKLYGRLMKDCDTREFLVEELTVEVHREAERLLLTLGREVRVRAADALHLALAITSGSRTLITFDGRMRQAAQALGVFELPTFL